MSGIASLVQWHSCFNYIVFYVCVSIQDAHENGKYLIIFIARLNLV